VLRIPRGFTLVERVVLIISLLAMLATPAIQGTQRKVKTAAIVNDLRVFAAAFDTYAHETGSWPTEKGAGKVPNVIVGWTALQRLA